MKGGVLAVCLGCCVLLGCRSVREVPVRTVIEQHTVLRDTVVKTYLVPYSDSIAVLDTVSYLRNPYAESRAENRGGRLLVHTLRTFPVAISTMVSLPTTTVRVSEEVPVVVEVEKRLTAWERAKVRFGGWGLVVLAFVLIRNSEFGMRNF